MTRTFFFSALFSLLFSFSCSLNYLKSENSEDKIPEFSFKKVNYSKYEASKKNISLKADKLEQYKSDNAIFVSNAQFETFDKEEKAETRGSCELVSANTKKEIYTLYGNINLNLPKQEMTIEADSLNFNKKTEQITSSRTGEVKLTKKDIKVAGYGFSASGVSNSFSFVDTVSGTIITDEKTEESPEEVEK